MRCIIKLLAVLALNVVLNSLSYSQDFHLDLTKRARIGFFTSDGKDVYIDRDENAIFSLVFDTTIYLANSTIINKAQLQAVTFKQYASFYRTQFNHEAHFENSNFETFGWFAFSTFKRLASFRNCKLKGYETFFGAQFNSTVDFSNDSITGALIMSNAIFKDRANFSNIFLAKTGSIDFANTTLPDTLIFSRNLRLESTVDLSNANFNDSARLTIDRKAFLPDRKYAISLYKADVSKFHIDYLHFRLLLTDPDNNNLLPDDEIKSVYEAVLKNFKDRGQTDSYELLDIEYQDFKWHNNKYFFWFGWFLHHWNSYGHKNELPLLWTIFLFAIFTITTFFFLNYLNKKVFAIDKIPHLLPLSSPFLSASKLFRRLWYACVYTARVFFPINISWDHLNPNRVLGTIYIVLVFLSGLLCLGYIANFIFQKGSQ